MSHYENLKNHFWQLRQEYSFSSVEADLYDYLLWFGACKTGKSTFQQSNALLCGLLGISEKTLIASRNRLKQAGLIDFKSGFKKSPSVYTIYWNISSKNGSINDSENDSKKGRKTPDILNTDKILNTGKNIHTSPTPELSEISMYAETIGGNIKMAEEFFDFYEGTGWIDGNGNEVKNWRAKFRTWKTNQYKHSKNNGNQNGKPALGGNSTGAAATANGAFAKPQSSYERRMGITAGKVANSRELYERKLRDQNISGHQ